MKFSRMMAFVFTVSLTILVSIGTGGITANGETNSSVFTNPILLNIADPYIIKEGGLYYLYGTDASNVGFKPYTSEDLVHWQAASDYCLSKGDDMWGDTDFWAPEVYKINGTYYMFYAAALSSGQRNIYVATSQSPLGPFVKYGTGPLVTDAIDPNLFIDSDGCRYLYYVKNSRIHGAKINSSFTKISGDALLIDNGGQPWLLSINVEGPEMMKHNGTYYLFFSGNGYNHAYGLGYATSSSPFGTYTKSVVNPLLTSTNKIFCPGHNCFAYSPDDTQLYTAYCMMTDSSMKTRGVCLDRVYFNRNGNKPDIVRVAGPTSTAQVMPSSRYPNNPVTSSKANTTNQTNKIGGNVSTAYISQNGESHGSDEDKGSITSSSEDDTSTFDTGHVTDSDTRNSESMADVNKDSNTSNNLGWVIGSAVAAAIFFVSAAMFLIYRYRKQKGISGGLLNNLGELWNKCFKENDQAH